MGAMSITSHVGVEALLHPDVVYGFHGMPTLCGRAAVAGYWRRAFASLSGLRVTVHRRIRDERVILAAYEKVWFGVPGGPVTADTVAILTLQDDLIRSWSDGFGQAAVADEARAFFARLRRDRW